MRLIKLKLKLKIFNMKFYKSVMGVIVDFCLLKEQKKIKSVVTFHVKF
jgi:hypothetical protein